MIFFQRHWFLGEDDLFCNAIGSMEGVISSLTTMGIYCIMSMVGPDLGWQVGVSATAALFARVCFGAFMYMYHMYLHHRSAHQNNHMAKRCIKGDNSHTQE